MDTRSLSLNPLLALLAAFLGAGFVACDNDDPTAPGRVGAPDAPTDVTVQVQDQDVNVRWSPTDQTAASYRVSLTSGGGETRSRSAPGPASSNFDEFAGDTPESIGVTFRDLAPGPWAANVVAVNDDGSNSAQPVQFTISG